MKKRTAAALLGMVLCLSTGVFARDIKSSNSNPHPGWIRYETNMLAFYYAPDSIFTKDKSISEFAGKYAAAYENIISGLCLEKRPPIKVFVYDDDESAIKLIGRRAGKAEPNLGLIHARLDSTTGHEMCHIIADTLNNGVRPPRNMMDEGLATCFDFTSRDRFAEGCELLEKGKLVSSVDMAAAERSDQLDYASAGAYVGYLVATYGIDKFKMLWCADKRAYDAQFKRIYGKSQEQVEQDWRAFLKAYKSAEESEFKIPANRPEGVSLGQLEKGDCLLIRFRWGEWSSGADKPLANPDISSSAMPIKVCGTGKQAIQIPRATRSVPFLLPIQDSAEYSIRASDALNTYKDNNGFVLLKVRVLKNLAQKEDVAAAQNRVQTNTYARPMLRSLTEDNRTTRLPVPVTHNNTNDTATQESMQKLSDLCTKREKQDAARYTPAEIAEMYKGGNIHDLERIIAKYPESNPASVYCLRIGKMNEFKKDSKAEEYLRMAIKTDGVYRYNEQLYQVKPLAMLHLARYYAKTGKKDEALKLLTGIRDDFPSAVLEDGKSLIVKGVVFQSLSSEVGGK